MSEVSSYSEDTPLFALIEKSQSLDKELLQTMQENTKLKIQHEVLLERERAGWEIEHITEEADRHHREVIALLVALYERKIQDAVQNERRQWLCLLEDGWLGWLRHPPDA